MKILVTLLAFMLIDAGLILRYFITYSIAKDVSSSQHFKNFMIHSRTAARYAFGLPMIVAMVFFLIESNDVRAFTILGLFFLPSMIAYFIIAHRQLNSYSPTL